jgi:hypothetical protein
MSPKKRYSDLEISDIIGRLTVLADNLEMSGRPDTADTIDTARSMLLYFLKMKKEIHGICNGKS